MPRLRNIEKVANALGCEFETFSDKSASWVNFEDKNFTVNINFDGKGEKFTGITIAQKIYQVVDEKVIAKIIK
jgi:hypothetical protein